MGGKYMKRSILKTTWDYLIRFWIGVVWDNIVAVAIFHLSFLAAAYLLFNHEKD
jgi:hypothetical protein